MLTISSLRTLVLDDILLGVLGPAHAGKTTLLSSLWELDVPLFVPDARDDELRTTTAHQVGSALRCQPALARQLLPLVEHRRRRSAPAVIYR